MAAPPDILPISLSAPELPCTGPSRLAAVHPQPLGLSPPPAVFSQHLYEDSAVRHKEEVLGIHALPLHSSNPLSPSPIQSSPSGGGGVVVNGNTSQRPCTKP